MKKIYIDSDFKCHITDDGTMKSIETEAFDGLCDGYIEGCRFVPAGECWTRDDGSVFFGEMITPWKNSTELDELQREYEKHLLSEYAEALKTLGVTV